LSLLVPLRPVAGRDNIVVISGWLAITEALV
jgi:hypothetical protein